MTSNSKTDEGQDSAFSFGVRELRQAEAAEPLSLKADSPKPATPKQGFDPYNTSGSFDRKKNWTRVGKR